MAWLLLNPALPFIDVTETRTLRSSSLKPVVPAITDQKAEYCQTSILMRCNLRSILSLFSNLSLRTSLYYGQFVWSQKCQKSDTFVKKRTIGSVLVSVLDFIQNFMLRGGGGGCLYFRIAKETTIVIVIVNILLSTPHRTFQG